MEMEMSNTILAIIIAVIIMIPAILFYELIIVRNYADKFLPPTILSLFSNGNPRNLEKKNVSSNWAYFIIIWPFFSLKFDEHNKKKIYKLLLYYLIMYNFK